MELMEDTHLSLRPSDTCGMNLGDYLELMVIYALTHKLGDDVVAQHHETMARLQGIRERNTYESVNKALKQFHKTRREYDPTYKPRHEGILVGN